MNVKLTCHGPSNNVGVSECVSVSVRGWSKISIAVVLALEPIAVVVQSFLARESSVIEFLIDIFIENCFLRSLNEWLRIWDTD